MAEMKEQEITEEKREDDNESGYTENLYEEMERDLCRRCKRRRIDRSENPESILCRECREELIKLKIPPVMIVTGILVLGIVGICLLSFGVKYMMGGGYGKYLLTNQAQSDYDDSEYGTDDGYDEDYEYAADEPAEPEAEPQESLLQKNSSFGKDLLLTTECREAVDYTESGYVVTGLNRLLTILEENPDNINAAVVTVDLAMRYTYPDYASYVIQNFLVEKTVSDEIYEKITGYIDELNLYYDTSDKADEIWNQAAEAWGEGSLEALNAYHDGLAACLEDEAYDQAFLNYCLFYACIDEDEQVEHLKNCLAINDNYSDAKAQLGVYYRNKGELDKSRQLLEAGYQNNKEVYSVTRGLATLELVENELEQGLIHAKEAYDMYPEGDYVADTYIIALRANGQEEEAERLTKELEEQGYFFDDDFYEFQKGEMTLEEYYTIGEEEE